MIPPEWYPGLRHAHIGLVVCSVALFAVRGAGVMAGAGWPLAGGVRGLSVAIDSLLLLAGVGLWMLLGLNPAGPDTWLGAKLLGLVAYVGLGTVALKRGRTRTIRALAWLAALGVVGWMASVALRHDPRGFLAWS